MVLNAGPSVCVDWQETLANCRVQANKPGRKKRSAKCCTAADYEAMAKKSAEFEKCISQLLDYKSEPSSSAVSKRRRLTKKHSSVEDISHTKTDVVYEFSQIHGRLFSRQVSCQTLRRRALKHLASHTVDLDIKNAVFVIARGLVQKLDLVQKTYFSEELATLDLLCDRRDEMIRLHLGPDLTAGKLLLQKALGGGQISEGHENNSLLLKVSRLARVLRWAACSVLPDVYTSYSSREDKRAESSTFAIFWQRAENMIICSWYSWILQHRPSHLSLHFDGIRVDAKCIESLGVSVDDFNIQAEKHIREATGFDVKIVEKKHQTFIEMLLGLPHQPAAVPRDARELLRNGNCIPLGLWRCNRLGGDILGCIKEDDASNAAALATGSRTYRRSFSVCKVVARAHVGFSPKVSGFYLLHFEGDGNPHCVAVEFYKEQSKVTVYHEELVFKEVDFELLSSFVTSSVDRSSIVSFQVASRDEDLVSVYTEADELSSVDELADLKAGAGSPDDLECNADDCKPLIPLLEPDDDCCDESVTHIRSVLFTLLEQEVSSYKKELESHHLARKHKRGDAELCALCPFRCFRTRRQLLLHVCKDHSDTVKHVASGRKQLNIVYGLFDHDQVSQYECHKVDVYPTSTDTASFSCVRTFYIVLSAVFFIFGKHTQQ